ncbi:MAG: carboxypeptidase regulatory-like domain-containing protein [bacterium]|nr:carboxypeptidase regulatory-like domain-containing protein [bacterium]
MEKLFVTLSEHILFNCFYGDNLCFSKIQTSYNSFIAYLCFLFFILAAIQAATTGDTVWVADGTYTGTGNKDLTWTGKQITVRSVNGPANCIIDCQNSGRGFFLNGAGDCGTISGFTIRNGYVTGAFPANCGGGIFCWYSSPTITNCLISGNSANYNGGGIFCYISSPQITNCTISNNSAGNGGGIYHWSSSPTITNCLISGNSASYGYGGGIRCNYSSSPTITNCTISNNSATYGGGIRCNYSSSPTVTNSILWNDTPQEIYLSGSSINITYSDIKGGWPGAGNINANPLFVGGGDYHLQSTSPCIDTGTNSAVPSWLTTDLDGNPRIVNGRVDMGAYEFQEIPPLISVSPKSGPIGIPVTVQGQNFATNTTITIDFGTHLTITTTTSSPNGTFSTIFIVDTQPPCTKLITASDKKGNKATTIFLLTPKPSISVYPSQGKVCDIITVIGKGFCYDSLVIIDFGTHLTITTATAISGTFSTTFHIETQPPCTKTVTARSTCCIGPFCATTIFLLEPDPKITLISPTSGPVGTVVTIAGSGFGPNTEITIAFGTNPVITTTLSSSLGTFSATFIVDNQPTGTKRVTASDLSGDCATSSFFLLSSSLSDLSINYLHISPPAWMIKEGKRMMISTRVVNIGSKTLSNVKVGFFDGDTMIEKRDVGTLSVNEAKFTLIITRAYPSGLHTIKVVADCDQEITEINEENNTATQTITVLPNPGKGVIKGTVSDSESGNPLHHAIVMPLRSSPEITNEKGEYMIGSLDPGTYSVFAYRYGYLSAYKEVQVSSETVTNLDLPLKKIKSFSSSLEEHLKMFTPLNFERLMVAGIFWNLRNSSSLPQLSLSTAVLSLSSKDDSIYLMANTHHLSGCNITLKFDPDVIRIKEIEGSGYTISNVEDGRLNISTLFPNNPYGEDGTITIAKIKIEPISDKKTEIGFISFDLRNGLNEPIKVLEVEDIKVSFPLSYPFSLLQSYPNPAKDGCWIPFQLRVDSDECIVNIYNIVGQKIKTINAGPRKAGSYTKQDRAIFWDGKNDNGQKVSKGLYFINLKADKFSASRPMVIR